MQQGESHDDLKTVIIFISFGAVNYSEPFGRDTETLRAFNI